MSYQRLLGLMGICRKARMLIYGYGTCLESIKNGRVVGVFTASDISAKTYKELVYYCEKYHTRVQTLPLSMEEVGRGIGRKTAVLGILDEGFFTAMTQALCESQ